MNGKIGLIFNGVWSQYALATAPKYADIYRLIYIHDLTAESLQGLDALVIPFQSHQAAIAERKELLYLFLAQEGKIALFGDSTPDWVDATWEDRPVNNYWWVANPENPPISRTSQDHPVFRGLAPRYVCWHVHGVYTRMPDQAEVLQTNAEEEIITWQTTQYGGVLFASTLDPIVEHGIQQIRHLDNFVDSLTEWLCGVRVSGAFEIPNANYGASAPLATTLT